MSGGSYDYLYTRILEELTQNGLGHMAERCADRVLLGATKSDWYDEAAKRSRPPTSEEIAALNRAAIRLRRALYKVEAARSAVEPLLEVMRAVEWWASCDSGPDDVVDRLLELEEKERAT